MKDGWYGDWDVAEDADIKCPEYVERVVAAIKKRVFSSFGTEEFVMHEDQIVTRLSVRFDRDPISRALLLEGFSGTIGWKARFTFKNSKEANDGS